MGNNDSLPPPPPPPPPGQPHVPPMPPAAAAPPPPPGAPVPPVQGFAPTQAYPQQAPPPVPAPQKSKTPWIIGGAVAAIAAVIVAVVVLGGGDEDTPTLGGDDTEVTQPVVVPTSVPVTEPATEDTFVITAPETTQPPATVAPTVTVPATGDGVISVTDDTNSFSVFFPDTFQTDTAPIDAQGVQFAQVSGSEDLQAYVNDHDTFGITLLGAPADQVAAPPELVNIFDPGAEVCTQRVPQTGYVTTLGTAEVLLLDGCGTGGAFAKVIMVVSVPDQNAIVVAVAQGAGPANDSLLAFTQAVVESVTPVS